MEIFSMAKVLLGPIIGQISGSIGGATYSHNRFGYYIRQKVKPVVINTSYTNTQRSIFKMVTSAWKSLLPATALSWNIWAQNNPVTDSLGMSNTLTGHQAHQKLNINAMRTDGSLLTAPPFVSAPAPLTSLSIDPSIAANGPEITFLKTPMTADEYLQVDVAITDSPNIKNVNSFFKRIIFSFPSLTSPQSFGPEISARFGTLIIGQRVTFRVSIISGATGLQSVPLIETAVLTA
jgi:hypothetical protein